MATDFLNVIERALMMGVSDTINGLTDSENIHIYGEFPEVEDLKFPAVIVQQTGSGFEEQMMGQGITFGSSSGSGEIYGITYMIHVICEKETQVQVKSGASSGGDVYYKQRRLLNWLMLNVANAVSDLNWDVYEEEDLEVLERHLNSWSNIGYISELQWYGASADFLVTFKNYRA